MKINEILSILEEWYPLTIASDFDEGRIGLLIGDEKIIAKNIMLTLDLTEAVVEEAIEKKCNLIITHHPYFYEPLSKVMFQSERGKVLRLLFKHNISVYAMHTNYDVGFGGINDTLAFLLGIQLHESKQNPEKDVFLRYGNVKPQTLMELVQHVKKVFGLQGVRVSGNLSKTIAKVGIVGGSGAHLEDIDYAISKKVDCYITGEIKLHIAQYAKEKDLALIEINHGVEKLAFIRLKEELSKKFQSKLVVYLTDIETDPFITI